MTEDHNTKWIMAGFLLLGWLPFAGMFVLWFVDECRKLYFSNHACGPVRDDADFHDDPDVISEIEEIERRFDCLTQRIADLEGRMETIANLLPPTQIDSSLRS